MATEKATTRILRDLHGALAKLSGDLDRVEILTGALAGFSRPVPDYEPAFRHLNHLALSEHELGGRICNSQTMITDNLNERHNANPRPF
jgi:hypothetical protein